MKASLPLCWVINLVKQDKHMFNISERKTTEPERLADEVFWLARVKAQGGRVDQKRFAVAVGGLQQLGFRVMKYSHLLHVFPVGLVEVLRFRFSTVAGIGVEDPEECLEHALFYLEGQQMLDEAASNGRRRWVLGNKQAQEIITKAKETINESKKCKVLEAVSASE